MSIPRKNRRRCAYIDWQAVARTLRVGDLVRVFNLATGAFSPWEGMLTAVMPGIGMVDIQTPWGNVRRSAEEVVVTSRDVFPELTHYDSWDIRRSLERQLMMDSHKDQAPPSENTSLEDKLASRCLKERVAAAVAGKAPRDKWALYWAAKGRQYRPNDAEYQSGEFSCPDCKTPLKRTHYKLRTKLYVCPNPDCLFCIKPSDIIDLSVPDDAPEELTPDNEDFLEPADPRLT
jgi:hypothetical protein